MQNGGVPPLLSPPPGATGLDEAEASRRLARDGPNHLPRGKPRSPVTLVIDVLREPMVFLLVGAVVLYVLFGEPRDAILLAASVGVIVTLDVVQEYRAERTLEALRDLSQPTARVLRAGAVRRLPSDQLVRGDWVLVAEGERVPADSRVRSGAGLLVDESLLTGESVPVRKLPDTDATPWARPGGEDQPFLFASTLVVRGQGFAEVEATGAATEVSRIAIALSTLETGTPLLRRQTAGLVRAMAILAVIGTAVVAIAVGLRTGGWIEGLLAGTALAIGLLPEEIPVVLTLYSVLGARRMARHRALARKFGTIPTLGAVTVLLTDKTGTLTENRMRVVALCDTPGHVVDLDGTDGGLDPSVRPLAAFAHLASEPESHDPMEQAIAQVGSREATASVGPSPVRLRHEPFTPESLSVTNVWAASPDGREVLARKGAPEAVLGRDVADAEQRARWEAQVRELSTRGLRVLAVTASERSQERPRLVGLVGLADPLRAGVPAAVRECQEAGIRVVMMTGDHPETARAIALAAGLPPQGRVVTGAELGAMSDDELTRALETTSVFARITPDEKLRVVSAFCREGEIVAMTGDGVNDAPALRAADVGIAMGSRGTDVAREAASLVLLDDAFPTIVEAIGMGRRIHGNMRKAIGYLISVHVALAGMALLPVLLGLPILLFPIEIVFLELIVDPASSLAFEGEPEETGLMRHAPRPPGEPLVSAKPLAASLTVGLSATAATLAVYFVSLSLGYGAEEARALSFATLVVSNLTLLHLNRSYDRPFYRAILSPNPIAAGVTVLGSVLLLLAIYVPSAASVFAFSAPGVRELLIAVAAGIGSVVWFDPLKRTLAEPVRFVSAASGARAEHRRGDATGPRL